MQHRVDFRNHSPLNRTHFSKSFDSSSFPLAGNADPSPFCLTTNIFPHRPHEKHNILGYKNCTPKLTKGQVKRIHSITLCVNHCT